jgi:hypothetical protein
MKKGKLLVGSFAVVCALPLATASAVDLPQRGPARGFSGLVEAEDAPPPAVEVFEVQAAPAAPVARPLAPAFAPAVPAPLAPVGGEPAPADGNEGVNRIRVQLIDSSQLVGQIDATTPLVVRSKFGEVKIPLDDIALIDPAVDDGEWRVTLVGGDRLTGALKLTGVKLKTAFGEVALDDKKISAIESGKLITQQIAVARTSPDGRTRSVAYRTRQIFAPVMPHASADGTAYPHNPYGALTPAYAPAAYSAPSPSPHP